MTETAESISFVHEPSRHRYEIRDGDKLIGFTEYRLPAGGNQVDFIHTEVDDGYAGQGLASRLVDFALADVSASGRRIIPHCSYVAHWLRRHHTYDDIIDWPTARP